MCLLRGAIVGILVLNSTSCFASLRQFHLGPVYARFENSGHKGISVVIGGFPALGCTLCFLKLWQIVSVY